MDRSLAKEGGKTMNPVLLRKELVGLRLCIALSLGLTAFSVLFTLATSFPDHEPFKLMEFDPSAVLFGMLAGMLVMGQEREYHTQGFLDSLPVSRSSVFLHKTMAALLVLLFAVMCDLGESLFFGWLSRTSLSEPIAWDHVLIVNSLRLLMGLTALTVSMMLAHTRQWFPLFSGLTLWGIVWLRATDNQLGPWLDGSAIYHPAIDHGRMLVPWRPVQGFAILAGAAWILAGIGFLWRDGRITHLIERISAWRFSAWLAGVSRLTAIVVWIFAFAQMAKDTEPPRNQTPAENRAAGGARRSATKGKSDAPQVVGFATHRTKRYELVYRQSQSDTLFKRIEGIDAVYGQASSFFQDPAIDSDRIVVDVASFVMRHAAGQTNWTKIRIPLDEATNSIEFGQILRHETGHVFIEQISHGLASSYFNAMRAFHEGVATAVELSVPDERSKTDVLRMEQWAAGAASRGKVSLDLLCENTKLSDERDPALVYPLGYVFAQALIQAGGQSLPRRVLESLHEHPPAPGVNVTEFWRHVLQQCGTSYDLVISIYEERVKAIEKREKLFIARYPRLSGKVTVEGDEVVIRPDQSSPTVVPGKIICMVDQDLGIAHMPTAIPPQADGSFHLHRSGNKVKYMLGWSAKNLRYPIFEPWANEVIK